MADQLCPLCGENIDDDGCVIEVCRTCDGSLRRSGDNRVSSTEEFTVDQLQSELDSPQPSTTADRSEEQVRCTWCERSAEEVGRLLSNRDAHICAGCVELCAQIFAQEPSS